MLIHLQPVELVQLLRAESSEQQMVEITTLCYIIKKVFQVRISTYCYLLDQFV